MNNAEAFELLGTEQDILIQKAHRAGLNYWQILGEYLRKVDTLYIQAEVEYQTEKR